MFASGASYGKLKTNLRLAVNRLKLLEKKKTELAQKARREIADYLSTGKLERARIRVEHIVREDYLVEAMEMVEMYCDLLLARFGIIQQMKTLDDGLAEAISSLIWAAPRLQTDVTELKVIAEQLTQKYGKQYALACRDNSLATVNEKLVHKLGVQAPPRILVERYLIEIARSHNVPYEPDPDVMNPQPEEQSGVVEAEAMLIDLGAGGGGRPGDGSSGGASGGGGGGGGGGQIGFVVGPQPIMQPQPPFSYPSKPPSSSGSTSYGGSPLDSSGKPPPLPQAPPSAPFPSLSKEQEAYRPYQPSADTQHSNYDDSPLPPYDEVMRSPAHSYQPNQAPKPTPMPRNNNNAGMDTLPELPAVPTGSLSHNGGSGGGGEASGDDVDFDDLAKRFEALKKKK